MQLAVQVGAIYYFLRIRITEGVYHKKDNPEIQFQDKYGIACKGSGITNSGGSNEKSKLKVCELWISGFRS